MPQTVARLGAACSTVRGVPPTRRVGEPATRAAPPSPASKSLPSLPGEGKQVIIAEAGCQAPDEGQGCDRLAAAEQPGGVVRDDPRAVAVLRPVPTEPGGPDADPLTSRTTKSSEKAWAASQPDRG